MKLTVLYEDMSLSRAAKEVMNLYHRGVPMGAAISQIATTSGIPTLELSHHLNPPKFKIDWKVPDLNEEADGYFGNAATQKQFLRFGYKFGNERDLIEFLSHGKLSDISRLDLMTKGNLAAGLENDPEYHELDKKLRNDIHLSLPAPIVIKFGNSYWILSGAILIDLAWNHRLLFKVWLVEAGDRTSSQTSLF
jgi:hypothetical protein